MVGSGGRTPFVGHFRGTRVFGDCRLSWAGRIAATASVTEGWEAAESARSALADLPEEVAADGATEPGGTEPRALLARAILSLGRIDRHWLTRGDLSVLFVACRDGVACATGSGLSQVWARPPAGGAWIEIYPSEHPIFGDPGVVPSGSWEIPADAERWVGVPAGLGFPTRALEASCGVRA